MMPAIIPSHHNIIVMLRPSFDTERDHFLKGRNAPVELVQYGGYQGKEDKMFHKNLVE
jgi:hypothetical protein